MYALAQAADRRAGPWRGRCILPRMPSSAARHRRRDGARDRERRRWSGWRRRRPRRSTRSPPAGIYKDGTLIGDIEAIGVPERRRLAFAGHVAVVGRARRNGRARARSRDRADRPAAAATATAGRSRRRVLDAVLGTLDSIPRPRRRDPEIVARGGPPRGQGGGRRGLGQEAELHGLRRGRMTAAMIGRLNHVAIAVPDLAAAAALYRDELGRQRSPPRCRSRSTA